MRPGELFSWIDPGDGRFLHFDIYAMWQHARRQPTDVERIVFPIEPHHVELVLAHRSVDVTYARRLTLHELRQPVLGVEMPDGTTLTVDGHHRYWRWFDLGLTEARMDRFAVGAHEPFLIRLSPAFEELIRAEIHP